MKTRAGAAVAAMVLWSLVESACVYSSIRVEGAAGVPVIVWDKSLCRSGNAYCFVNSSTCEVITQDTKWKAIGSFKDFPSNSSSWTFDGDLKPKSLEYMAFPDHVQYLTFRGVYLAPLTKVSWPANLRELIMPSCNLKNVSTLLPLPPRTRGLGMGQNKLSSLAGLPRNLTDLDLDDNPQLTELANLDLTRMTRMSAANCVSLHSIDMVHFTKSLVYLDLSNLTITSWIMTNATFKALDGLVPFLNNAGRIGFGHAFLKIFASESECNTRQGTIEELWAATIAERDPLFSLERYFVCVVKDGAPTTAALPTTSSTTPAPPTTTALLVTSADNTTVIVGVSAGALFLLGAVAWTCRTYRRRRAKLPALPSPLPPAFPDDTTTPSSEYTDMGQPLIPPPPIATMPVAELDLSVLATVRLDVRAVNLSEILGSGAFANVWTGTFMDTPVAVKKLQGNRTTAAQIQSFVAEIDLMSKFESPFLVQLIGAAWTRPLDLMCVMELMDGGDLKQCIDSTTPETFSWRDKLSHMLSIVEGLVYLHSLYIIHRDVKSRNVLLDSTKGTKLVDFGISKEDMQATMTLGVGSFRWMAPEVLMHKGYSTSADIYSFGVVLSELATHQLPYSDVRTGKGQPPVEAAILLKLAAGTIKPSFAEDSPAWVVDMADRCLQRNPCLRPSAIQLSHMIKCQGELMDVPGFLV